ncbi:hypothetical protein SCHPADRAFT_937933 [Schizopora paradoxa]|uniref:Autophagy-related protein 29 n=1 Tax=Schizopora paradoxa TaxID=27342 RepID=A0A0H2SGT0_9AGAM|nr:hypothetical protein SCHPADRAFT_937933 [Schizopora paradoxa]
MPSPQNTPPVRVIVRLPYNRPKEGVENPPPAIQIEWNADKESVLWEVVARFRASDKGVPPWQALAEQLSVPLPYLLYRAQVRYEEDLKGLQGLRGVLSPTAQQGPQSPFPGEPKDGERPPLARRISARSGHSKLVSSLRLSTPLGVRARLNSIGYDSVQRQSKESSSSTLTLQATKNATSPIKANDSPYSSESDSDEEQEREEAEEKMREEQEALDQKLKRLKSVMTNDTLGLVRTASSSNKGKEVDRGRDGLKSPTSPSPLRQSVGRRDLRSLSASENSTTSSPHGSIPSIPSPSSESLSHSPVGRHLHQAKKSYSPPMVSPGHARGQSHMSFRPLIGVSRPSTSDTSRSSNQGSNASSFSDISDSNFSPSALDSALNGMSNMSNIRGGGSRLSAFARSQFNRKPSGGG